MYYVLSPDDSCSSGDVGTSALHRRWANLSLGETVTIQPFDPLSEGQNCYLGTLKLEVCLHLVTTNSVKYRLFHHGIM